MDTGKPLFRYSFPHFQRFLLEWRILSPWRMSYDEALVGEIFDMEAAVSGSPSARHDMIL